MCSWIHACKMSMFTYGFFGGPALDHRKIKHAKNANQRELMCAYRAKYKLCEERRSTPQLQSAIGYCAASVVPQTHDWPSMLMLRHGGRSSRVPIIFSSPCRFRIGVVRVVRFFILVTAKKPRHVRDAPDVPRSDLTVLLLHRGPVIYEVVSEEFRDSRGPAARRS